MEKSDAAKKLPRVAIDGPAGAGKSTVARMLADRLGFVLVDTGALYRTVALAAKRAGVAWSNEPEVAKLAQTLIAAGGIAFDRGDAPVSAGGSGVQVLLSGEDVSLAIREPDMSLGASRVSAIPAVRDALLDAQRQAGLRGGVVIEGRDIGTVVFPDAEVKFFLTATPEIRAKRRFDELTGRGSDVSYEGTLDDVKRRDKADTERPVAPLRRADDAIEIDSSKSSIEDVIETMASAVEAWFGGQLGKR